jgi:serine/threonine-protein kinase RsbW
MSNSLRISCDKRNLKVIRDFITKFLRPYALSEIVQNQIILAVDEISANSIIHANQNNRNKHICLTISPQNGGLLFEITDQGLPFDPTKYKKPDIGDNIAARRPGGVGIALVNFVMDKVEYSTDENGTNICRLYKKVQTSSRSSNLINQ